MSTAERKIVALDDECDDFITSDEFISLDDENVDWVIRPLCVRGSGVMIYGRQGVGKSSITTQLCNSFITGKSFLGFPVAQTGRVLYLQLDMNELETKKVLRRAHDAGMRMKGDLLIPNFGKYGFNFRFNILRDEDLLKLSEWCDRFKPIAVVVDGIHDAYATDGYVGDVNALIRQVYRRFQDAINGAVLVFLNHNRKQGVQSQREDFDDEDAFMGGQAWEGLVASSLHLKKHRKGDRRGHVSLVLRKTRLELWPESEITLDADEFGFFEYKMPYKQMLMQWPECIDEPERTEIVAKVKSKADVFRDIEARTGASYDTIRVYENAHKQFEYPWKGMLAAKDARNAR